jgi:hypothetical protein
MQQIKAAAPAVRIVYGGVFPTYDWRDALAKMPVRRIGHIMSRGMALSHVLRKISASPS